MAYRWVSVVAHAVEVATTWAPEHARADGVTVEVFGAAICFVFGAGAAGMLAAMADDFRVVLPLIGWPAFAMAGGVVLDRHPRAPFGRLLMALALVPVPVVVLALLQAGGRPDAADVSDAISELTALAVVWLAIGIPGTFRDRALSRAAMACSLVATGRSAGGAGLQGLAGPDAMRGTPGG